MPSSKAGAELQATEAVGRLCPPPAAAGIDNPAAEQKEKSPLALSLLELSKKAPQVTGGTNNRTEQLIGRAFKIRVGTMRGFKREANRMHFLHLALAVDRRAQREGLLYLL